MSAQLVPFDYLGREVRTVTIDGEPWFVAADLCAILELGNVAMATQGMPKDNVSKTDVIDAIGRLRATLVVNEPGLYRLIFRSNKPKADRFQNWIYREVLPSIRKTGRFQVDVPFLLPTCKPWSKTFPDDFNGHVFRLKGLVPSEHARWMGHVHNDLIYSRLDEGVYESLRLLNPRLPGKSYRGKKHHQFVAAG